MQLSKTVGVIGGSGQLGGAIARAWLRSGCITPENLWISNRSGKMLGFEEWTGISLTTRNQDLADACDVVFLSVPPQLVKNLEVEARDSLVISVMAGVSIDVIEQQIHARRVIRAMSNPAADLGLAYSPWCSGDGVSGDDRDLAHSLLAACGETDEVPSEDQIDRFTALTGPVPGFVAFFAECMVDYAAKHGIDETVANKAIRQLFRASGAILGSAKVPPREHVAEMNANSELDPARLR